MVNLRSRQVPDKPAEVGTPRRRRASSAQPETGETADRETDLTPSRRLRASSVYGDSPRPKTQSRQPEDVSSTPRSRRLSLRSNTPDISKTIKSNLFDVEPEEEDVSSTPRSRRKSLRSNTPDISKTIKSNLFDVLPEEVIKTRPAPIEEKDESPEKRGARKSKESDTKRELKAVSSVPSKNVEMDSSTGDSEKTSASKVRRGSLGKVRQMKITDFGTNLPSPVIFLEDIKAKSLEATDSEGKKRRTSPTKQRRESLGKGMFDSSIEGKLESPIKSRGRNVLDKIGSGIAVTESKVDRSKNDPQNVRSLKKSSKSASNRSSFSSDDQGKKDELSTPRRQTKSPSPDKISSKRLSKKSESGNEDTNTIIDISPPKTTPKNDPPGVRSPRKSSKSESNLISFSSSDREKNDELSTPRRQTKSPSPDKILSRRLSRKSESGIEDSKTIIDSSPPRTTPKNDPPSVKSPRKSSKSGSDPISVSVGYKGNKDEILPTRRKEKSPSPDKKSLKRLSRKSDSSVEGIKKISDPSRSSPKDPSNAKSPRKSEQSKSGRISASLDEPNGEAEGLTSAQQEQSPSTSKKLLKWLSRKSESSIEDAKITGGSSPSRTIPKTDSAYIRSPRKSANSGSALISVTLQDQKGKTEGSPTPNKEMSPLLNQRSTNRSSKSSESEGGFVAEEDETRRRTNSRSDSAIGISKEDLAPSPKKDKRLSTDKGRSEQVSVTSFSIDDSVADETSETEILPVAISPIKNPSYLPLKKRSDRKVSDAAMSHDSNTIDSSRSSEGNGASSKTVSKSEQLLFEVEDTESGQKRKSLQLEDGRMSLEKTVHSINPKEVANLVVAKNGGDSSPLKLSEPSSSKLVSEPVFLNRAMEMDWEPTKTPESKNYSNISIEMKRADSSESDRKTRRKSKNPKRRKSGSERIPVSSEFQVSSLQAGVESSPVLTKNSPLPGTTMIMDVTEINPATSKDVPDGLKKRIRGKKKNKFEKLHKSSSEQLVSSLDDVSSSVVLKKGDTSLGNNVEVETEKEHVISKGISDDVNSSNAPSKKKKKRRKRNKSVSEQVPTSAGCLVSGFIDAVSSSRVLIKDNSLREASVEADSEKELFIADELSGDTKSLKVSGKKTRKRSSKPGSDKHLLNPPKADSEAASSDESDSSDASSVDHKGNSIGEERTKDTNEKENKAPAPVEEIRHKDNTWKMGDSEVTVRRRGGGTIIGSRPVFSDDAKYVYVNCGWGVRVFSIETGECVRVFDAFSKDHKVVACFCWKSCPAALTSEGVFIAWDPRSGRVQQKMRINVRELVVDGFFFSVASETILCLALETKHSTWLQVYSGTTFRSQPQHPLNHREIGHPYNLHHLSVGCNPERPLIAFICKGNNKKCKIINIDNKVIGRGVLPGSGKDWTCVQCHPTEDTVALGDSTGRIVVYRIARAGNKNEMELLPSVYHWHTLPVSEVAFTSAGSSMYSGGGELTLVKWNLENPHIKNYLPRLSADIVHITVSPYNQMIAIATLDNGIQIVSPNNKLHCVLQQLSWSVFAGEQEGMFPAGLIYDPRSRGLMLNGRPGHLQLYSPLSETLTYNIDVTMMNYLTQERDKVIVNTQVTHSALTMDGVWLATIETRYEPGLALELKLKFWEYNVDKKRYVLATVIDMPHDGKIHSIKFSPGHTGPASNDDVCADHEVFLASTGADKKLRLWSKIPIDSIYQKGSTWRCQNACFYRDRSSGPCSFSFDGSLLAVGFNSVLTLWDTHKVVLKQTITRSTEDLKFVEFGRNDCCHILMSATDSNILAWNLLSLSLVWKVDTRTALFVPDPYSSFFAIFTVENQWKILDAHNGEVVFTMNSDGKSEIGYQSSKSQVLAAVFAPRHRPNTDAPGWMKNSYLYYIDIYQELNCLEPANEISQLPTFQLAFDKDAGTPFGSLVGAKSVREAADEEHTKQPVGYGVLGSQAVTQLLRPPAHTLPPVSLLCGSFLQSFVIMKRDVPHAQSDHDDKSEDDKTTVVASSDSEGESSKLKKSSKKSEKSPKVRKRKQNKHKKAVPAEKKEFDEPMETETIDLRKHFPPLVDDDDAEGMFVIDD